MRAAVLAAFGSDLELTELPVPRPGPDQVLVRVRAAGVCGTDLKLRDGATSPRPALPIVPGHEIAGEVAQDACGFAAGDRVACFMLDACGECAECRRGFPVFCPAANRLGLDRDGGMAEFVACPAKLLLRLPDDLAFEPAAVAMDSVMTPWYALHETGRLLAGERVTVVGVGGLGINAVQLALAAGAQVAAVDVSRARLDAAAELGADLAVTPEQLPELLAWGDDAIDMAVELSGKRAGFDVAAAAVRRGGRIVCCGYAPGVEYGLDSARLVLDDIQVLGSRNGTIEAAAAALGAVARGEVKPLIGGRRPLEAVNDALADLAAGAVNGRTVLQP